MNRSISIQIDVETQEGISLERLQELAMKAVGRLDLSDRENKETGLVTLKTWGVFCEETPEEGGE